MITDWRGTEIQVGSTIVYPGRFSSTLYMVEGYVLEIGSEQKYSKEFPFLIVKPLLEISHGKARTIKRKEVKITRVDLVTVLDD